MIDFALDPSETRATRHPEVRPGRTLNLRLVVAGLVGLGALGGFGVAASTLMSGLAAPTPVKFASKGRAADWPELKDGLPAIAGTSQPAAAAAISETPAVPAPRMAALPEAFRPAPTAKAESAPAQAAAPEPPTRRIPTPTQTAPLATARQVVPLPPARTATLQAPRVSETVRAREPAAPKAVAAAPAADKASRKPLLIAHKTPAPVKSAEKTRAGAATTVAQAEPAEPEETEVLGIKLPSLAPAGRKLKESVDALGDAVRKVF